MLRMKNLLRDKRRCAKSYRARIATSNSFHEAGVFVKATAMLMRQAAICRAGLAGSRPP
jgi:hypothetical protein